MDSHTEQERDRWNDQSQGQHRGFLVGGGGVGGGGVNDFSQEIEERDRAVADIETAMMDVNDIMQNLATVVNEQGDMLDNIESNMTVAEDRVESGVEQLVSANKYQKKSRNKMCCFLVIIMIVLAIMVVIIVVSSGGKDKPTTAASTTVQTTTAGDAIRW
eukprot:gene9539-24523_t